MQFILQAMIEALHRILLYGVDLTTDLLQLGAGRFRQNDALGAAVECVGRLLRETIELTDGLYRPRFVLPKATTNAESADGASRRR